MTVLVVDSGNSSVKWALLEHGRLIEHARSDSLTSQSLRLAWEKIRRPARVVVGNVAGQGREQCIDETVEHLWQQPAEFVHSTRSCCGVTNCYDDPARLGVDRWLAMLAARHLVEGPVIVIDCGTAITIDLVDEAGLFRGGVIMAGLGVSRAALRGETAQLDVYDQNHITAAATSTADAVSSGTALGLAGAIERIVDEQSEMLCETPSIMLCGGDAESLSPLLRFSFEIHHDLVLQGLQIYSTEAGNH